MALLKLWLNEKTPETGFGRWCLLYISGSRENRLSLNVLTMNEEWFHCFCNHATKVSMAGSALHTDKKAYFVKRVVERIFFPSFFMKIGKRSTLTLMIECHILRFPMLRFFKSSRRICFYWFFRGFLEKGREWGRGGRQKKRETSMWERNIHPLPPVHTPNEDWTHHLGMCSKQESNPHLLVYGRRSNQLSH